MEFLKFPDNRHALSTFTACFAPPFTYELSKGGLGVRLIHKIGPPSLFDSVTREIDELQTYLDKRPLSIRIERPILQDSYSTTDLRNTATQRSQKDKEQEPSANVPKADNSPPTWA